MSHDGVGAPSTRIAVPLWTAPVSADIAPFYGDDEAARKKVVEELADACARCGFFMIRGHRVPVEVIDACWKHCKEFFDGPLSIKEAINMAEDYPYGYSGLGTEIAGGSYDYGAADKKECVAFCLGPDGVADPRMPTPRWPAAPGGFKGAVTAYYREMESLARVLLRIMALALQQPEDFFDTYEDKHWSALRCLNYPHSDKPFSPGQMRIAAHTDYGSLTILRCVQGDVQLVLCFLAAAAASDHASIMRRS